MPAMYRKNPLRFLRSLVSQFRHRSNRSHSSRRIRLEALESRAMLVGNNPVIDFDGDLGSNEFSINEGDLPPVFKVVVSDLFSEGGDGDAIKEVRFSLNATFGDADDFIFDDDDDTNGSNYGVLPLVLPGDKVTVQYSFDWATLSGLQNVVNDGPRTYTANPDEFTPGEFLGGVWVQAKDGAGDVGQGTARLIINDPISDILTV